MRVKASFQVTPPVWQDGPPRSVVSTTGRRHARPARAARRMTPFRSSADWAWVPPGNSKGIPLALMAQADEGTGRKPRAMRSWPSASTSWRSSRPNQICVIDRVASGGAGHSPVPRSCHVSTVCNVQIECVNRSFTSAGGLRSCDRSPKCREQVGQGRDRQDAARRRLPSIALRYMGQLQSQGRGTSEPGVEFVPAPMVWPMKRANLPPRCRIGTPGKGRETVPRV